MVWFFERGSDCLTFDICRNGGTYEVHVQHPDRTRTLVFVGTAEQLVDQIHAVPQALITVGWRPRVSWRSRPVSRALNQTTRQKPLVPFTAVCAS